MANLMDDLLLQFVVRRDFGALMSDDEALECAKALTADPVWHSRQFSYGALVVAAAVTVRFPGARADRFMSDTLRMLRERLPYGVTGDLPEDHRD